MSVKPVVFVSGGTGYLGIPLIERLLNNGHAVHGLARPASVGKLPAGTTAVPGDALAAGTFADRVPEGCTYVHLTGTPHPAPWKAWQFRAVDLASLEASLEAAVRARVDHFIYVSVAHPAPVMRAYIRIRTECEELIRRSGIAATILRPWYVTGPGHRWAALLRPLYTIAELIPATREGALRLGLVTREQMVGALAGAVKMGADGVRVLDVVQIRNPCFTTQSALHSANAALN